MWQLEEQQQQYEQCSCGELHECHQYGLRWYGYTGHLGDIVHERFLRDERAEAADRGG
jgi:hypothetical protein